MHPKIDFYKAKFVYFTTPVLKQRQYFIADAKKFLLLQ